MTIAREAQALALATFDAVQGARPLHQLRPHLSSRAFQQLVAYRDTPTFRVRSAGRLRLCGPNNSSLEATGTLLVQQRWFACTLRLDWLARWICSDLRVVGFPA